MSERGQNRVYRKIYRDAHGDGPYTCTFCDEAMTKLEVVHHRDEDPSNNDLENLKAMHTVCHNKHHHVGLIHTEDDKMKIGAGLKRAYDECRRPRPDVSGEKNPFFGRRHTEETKAKISAMRRAR